MFYHKYLYYDFHTFYSYHLSHRFVQFFRMGVVEKGIWKKEKLESLKLESFCLSWKEAGEV